MEVSFDNASLLKDGDGAVAIPGLFSNFSASSRRCTLSNDVHSSLISRSGSSSVLSPMQKSDPMGDSWQCSSSLGLSSDVLFRLNCLSDSSSQGSSPLDPMAMVWMSNGNFKSSRLASFTTSMYGNGSIDSALIDENMLLSYDNLTASAILKTSVNDSRTKFSESLSALLDGHPSVVARSPDMNVKPAICVPQDTVDHSTASAALERVLHSWIQERTAIETKLRSRELQLGTEEGSLKREHDNSHGLQLDQIKTGDHNNATGNLSLTTLCTPTENCILLGQGNYQRRTHASTALNDIILQRYDEYMRYGKLRVPKTEMTRKIVEDLLGRGFQFLEQNESSKMWHVVDENDEESRAKMRIIISTAFRTETARRKREARNAKEGKKL